MFHAQCSSRRAPHPGLFPTRLGALGLLAALLAATAAHAVDITTWHSVIADIDKKEIWDGELLRAIDWWADGQQEDIQIAISSCSSGGFATQAPGRLRGNWSVATSRDQRHVENNDSSNKELWNGQSGFHVGEWYYQGWRPQYIKRLTQAHNTVTAQELANYARDNDHRVGGNPQFASGGTGATSTVRPAPWNHALIWCAHPTEDYAKPLMTALHTALEDSGYNNDTIDYAYGREAGHVMNGKPIDHNATKGALMDAIHGMGVTQLQPFEHKFFLFLNAHGAYEARKTELVPDYVPREPNQGRQFSNGSGTFIACDPDLRNALLESVRGFDDPDWQRVGQPSLAISTVEETFTGSVQVTLDNVPAGVIALQGKPDGADYDLDLSDSVLAQLFDSGAFSDGELLVGFHFGSGAFRVATEWDFDHYGANLNHYGIGIRPAFADADHAPVPEPAATALCALAVPLLVGRRAGRT